MERPTRREAMLAAGALAGGLAGCIDDVPGRSASSENGNGNGNRSGGGEETIVEAVDVFQLGGSNVDPLWARATDATGFVTLLESADDRPWMVDDPGEIEGLESWLSETDFEASTVVYVESVAPDTCYTEIEVDDVSIEDGEIVGRAAAVDDSDGDVACGMAQTYPSAFVRTTADDPPREASLQVTDGWGESGAVTTDGRIVDPAELPGHVRPGDDPEELATLGCAHDEFERHWSPDGEVALGEVRDEDGDVTFAMRVHGTQALGDGDDGTAGHRADADGDGAGDGDGPRVGRGHEVRVSMWNVSDDPHSTGNRHKYTLQVLTGDGWRDVRGWADGERLGYTDEGVAHRPGEGFEWVFEMTEDGVLEGHVHEDRLEVCPDLQPGRYRFCYHEADRDPLAVEFDYTD